MTLTLMDHAITKGLDLLMFLLIPFVVWLFRNRIRRWFKGNGEKKKCKNFKSEGMGM